jgi:hypothetical protein
MYRRAGFVNGTRLAIYSRMNAKMKTKTGHEIRVGRHQVIADRIVLSINDRPIQLSAEEAKQLATVLNETAIIVEQLAAVSKGAKK